MNLRLNQIQESKSSVIIPLSFIFKIDLLLVLFALFGVKVFVLFFRSLATVFLGPPENKEDIVRAGEQSIKILYGESAYNASIDELRYTKFKQKVATRLTTHVEPSSLPPTSGACRQHSLRVYLQVHTWTHFDSELSPTDWGWELNENGMYTPVYTTKALAPQDLLKIIRCG